ncbi:MAG TPA: type VII secretion-associated protein [Actinophytocola sp.]|uniref:type VII secretion-associated protein n=1 Tax=Actinophytocola sp. TaxID=1872138 RepID=UPI002DDD9AD7|nr:type VII secretion-associated protein [Actinophytocola sp.]HEV2780700.1 type VII secretion-associated protein [Actinophytocola sp.]
MRLRVAVDFGTSSTCIAVSVDGREPQVVAIDGHPLMSSAVYASPKGTLFVGQEADRQAAIDPSRYEPHPKRRVDEAELLLGNTVLGVRDVIRAVLARAVAEARRVAGGAAVDQLVLTHPADWGGVRTRVLRQAANGLAARITLIPEPVAAAVFHAASFPAARGAADRPLAVLDVGGGTVDVSVVRRQSLPGAPPYQVLATRGDPTFGGADIDQLLLEHVGSLVSTTDPDTWRALIEGRELPDRRRRRVIHQDVRGAKETLSRHAFTDVPLPPPFPDAHVTRADLERLISAPLRRAAELAEATIRAAGVAPRQLAGIFLVGGSSRIPMIARLVHERCGVVPTTLDQPETVVARGALRAVNPDPDRTGVVPARTVAEQAPPPRPAAPVTPARGQPVTVPPPAAPHRRLAWLGLGAVAVVGGVIALVLALTGSDGDPQTSPPTRQPQTGRVIAQYRYQFALPDGWTQTGGDPDKLATEVKPVGGERGDDRILVEQISLAFDSDSDRPRAVDTLRAAFDRAGNRFSDFDDNASYADRQLIHYRERLPDVDATVDWYVLFKAHTQVSIGCQYTEAARDAVRAACETVVRTLTITE